MGRRKRLAAAVAAGLTTTALAATEIAWADSFSLVTAAATGDQVVPGPGDPSAYGEPGSHLRLTLGGGKGGSGKIANSFFPWSAAGTPTAIRIHKGALGEAGPLIVDLPLKPDSAHPWGYGRGASDECVMLKIARKPGEYYVGGHTDAYPDGALRAQLALDPYNTDDQGQAAKLYKETCKKNKN